QKEGYHEVLCDFSSPPFRRGGRSHQRRPSSPGSCPLWPVWGRPLDRPPDWIVHCHGTSGDWTGRHPSMAMVLRSHSHSRQPRRLFSLAPPTIKNNVGTIETSSHGACAD